MKSASCNFLLAVLYWVDFTENFISIYVLTFLCMKLWFLYWHYFKLLQIPYLIWNYGIMCLKLWSFIPSNFKLHYLTILFLYLYFIFLHIGLTLSPLPLNVAHSINSGCVWGLESVLEMKDLTYRPGHPNVQNPIAKPHWDPGSVFRLEGLKI